MESREDEEQRVLDSVDDLRCLGVRKAMWSDEVDLFGF